MLNPNNRAHASHITKVKTLRHFRSPLFVPSAEQIIPLPTRDTFYVRRTSISQEASNQPFMTDPNRWHRQCIARIVNQPKPMKTTTITPEGFESTYALIVRSEERERGATEGAVFLLFMLSVLFSIWQVAQQPITLPTDGIIHTISFAESAATQSSGA